MPGVPWRSVAREPIAHFAAIAALLFGAHAALAPEQKPTIRVDEEVVATLLRERAALALRPMTEFDRQDVLETYIAEEVLLREAYRRGLNGTPRIRSQLIQAMRASLVGSGDRPDERELRRFFEVNRAKFERAPTISFSQITFADGSPVPDGLADRLNAGAVAASFGDFALGSGPRMRHVGAGNLVGLFGRDATAEIMSISDDRWHGPFRSARGTHFVRIDERHPAEMPSFEQAALYVAEEYEMARQAEKLAREVDALSRGYTILRPNSP